MAADRSKAIDTAYEEYCQRRECGQEVDTESFCDRFPAFKTSLQRLLEAHRFVEENPQILDECRPEDWPEVGDKFLDFNLLDSLGRGAFARVFLARESSLGERLVALKVAPGGNGEARTLGRLDHPNIVPVYSIKEDSNRRLTAVCMPYLGKATLESVLDRAFKGGRPPGTAGVILDAVIEEPLPEKSLQERQIRQWRWRTASYVEAVVEIGAQILDALRYVHERGVCHRDLKPSNVLLTPAGVPMLLDFNLSFDQAHVHNRLGGTLPYMPPEQILATAPLPSRAECQLDCRADIYSFGVILYELLTHRHPLGPLPQACKEDELRRYLLQRQQGRPAPIRRFNPDVDRSLERWIERCLAYDPNDRPQSAASLAAAFGRWSSPAARLCRWVGRHQVTATAAALMLVAGGATAAVSINREPVSVRHTRLALEAYRAHSFSAALAHLNEAIAANPESDELRFHRGRAYQQLALGQWAAIADVVPAERRKQKLLSQETFRRAVADFEASNPAAQGGLASACLGFCYNHLGRHADAIDMYVRALQEGLDSPVVYNNLAHSHLQLPRKQFDNIERYLQRAIERDPTLPAVWLNRIEYRLVWALDAIQKLGGMVSVRAGSDAAQPEEASDFVGPRRQFQQVLAQELTKLEEGVSKLSPHADIELAFARLYAAVGRGGEALRHLRTALSIGVDRGRIETEPLFRSLAGTAELTKSVANVPVSGSAAVQRLIDPHLD